MSGTRLSDRRANKARNWKFLHAMSYHTFCLQTINSITNNNIDNYVLLRHYITRADISNFILAIYLRLC